MHNIISTIAWNAQGLVAAIAQDAVNKQVLMQAWMNKESLQKTLDTGDVWYWSRSRQAFWRKGATSGHTQKLIEIYHDCDSDCLLLLIEQKGAACHTGRRSCFYSKIDDAPFLKKDEA